MTSQIIFNQKISAEEETGRKRRLHRCAFTGHRPEKLEKPESVVKAELRREIIGGVHDGFSVFISGMARGVAIWAAELVLDLQKEFRDIKLICAILYAGFELRWSEEWQARYRTILSHADYVRTLRPCYAASAFRERNMWMVRHSARLIAVYNGTPGGTRNTILYAKEEGIDIKVVELGEYRQTKNEKVHYL